MVTPMKPRQFESAVDQARVIQAIAAAEAGTSGEIRVVLSRAATDDALTAAREEFERLGMTRTQHRNAVLIYVAPKSQTFAVVGDIGIDHHCGEAFWSELAGVLREHFGRGDFTGGLVQAIGRAGELLARHFPRQPDDRNELPNAVEER